MENVILYKLFEGQYDKLTTDELKMISNHCDLFGLKKEFGKLVDAVSINYAFSLGEETSPKDSVNKYLKEHLPSRSELLNKFDDKSINEPNFKIDFKERFFSNVRKMDTLQLCYLIDKIGYYMKKKNGGLRFFGDKQHMVGAYHELNKTISNSFDTVLSFNFFYFNIKEKFLNVDYSVFEKDSLRLCLEKCCLHHFCLLERISDVILNFDENNLKNTTHIINKDNDFAYFKKIIIEGKVEANKRGGAKNETTWQLYIEDYYYLPGDE